MIKLIKMLLIFGIFISCPPTGVCQPGDGAKHVTVAILPCYDIVMTFKKFHPLITYLKQETGLQINMVVPRDFGQLQVSLKGGEIDFALQDPHTYVLLANLLNTDTIIKALTWEGSVFQHGVIITRKDSGIKSVSDLRGKSLMFGPKLSFSKWIAAKDLLKDNHINIDEDLRSYQNGGCCQDIAFNVYLKSVDAGVVCDHFLKEQAESDNDLGLDSNQLIAIAETGSVPTRVFVARKETDRDLVHRVDEALLKLDKQNPVHAAILYPVELGGFQRANDHDYDSVRVLMEEGF